MLRAIRFASRLNFSLDPELVDAGASADIRAALMDKVSRERVYKECDGCMSKENSRPYLAFRLMHRCASSMPLIHVSLYCFTLPSSSFKVNFHLLR